MKMPLSRGARPLLWACLFGASLAAVTVAQTKAPATFALDLPAGVKTLEGVPQVQVDTTETATTRQRLDPADAARKRLTIRIDQGRYFSGSDSHPLNVSTSGDYVYLTSTEPGRYIRLRRVNQRLTYVEHIDMGARSVTYWGELRIVLGR